MHQSITGLFRNYRTLRALQISTVFVFTFMVQDLLRYPRAGWTGFALMMIYAGFDNGTTILRAYHRFWGALLGVFTGFLLWFLGHIDYRTLILVIPITVFLAYFLAGRAYSVPTVFTVSTAIIGTGYFDTGGPSFSVTFYLTDYCMCTIIAFAIILIFEYFVFRRYQLMQRFISDTQIEVIRALNRLVDLLYQDKIKRTDWFKGCISLTGRLAEVEALVRNSQFAISAEHAVGDEFDHFVVLSNRIFIGLKALYAAYYIRRHRKFDYYQLVKQVHADLTELKTLVVDAPIAEGTSGVMNATPN